MMGVYPRFLPRVARHRQRAVRALHVQPCHARAHSSRCSGPSRPRKWCRSKASTAAPEAKTGVIRHRRPPAERPRDHILAARPVRDLVLEDDDDIELLEHIKDRRKRLEKQGMINSSGTETGHSVSSSHTVVFPFIFPDEINIEIDQI
ncbi:hypothetical protein HU200_007965 [Digitaria exilis]|uniref:Uncharacterized protein n=1 Tax=Digitaria exilis TaxID=1010633 RepID=A0A835KQN7_9POAL|nr:hypothetical protein HU200_007965 [Digitaria exilis]